jgi:hypothetical protein
MLVSHIPNDQSTNRTHHEGATENAKTLNQVGMLIIFWSWRKEDLGNNIYIATNKILEFAAQRNSKLVTRLIQLTRKETKESKIIPLQHIAHNTGSCVKP